MTAKQEQNTRFPTPMEVIGSKDLRESFNDNDRIRGSFFINGVEMHQFDANSPASVVSQINAQKAASFVTAEIDDGGHLVLIDKSGADIRITKGAAYVEPEPVSTGDATKDLVRHLDRQDRRNEADRKEPHGNNVLEALGLAETAKASEEKAPRPGFETGRSKEERQKAHEESLGIVRPAASKPSQTPPSRQADPHWEGSSRAFAS